MMDTLSTNNKLKICSNSGKIRIDPDTICYCRTEGCYTRIFLKSERSYLLSRTLNSIEKQLPGEYFLRCHRSYLVNIREITSIDIKERIAYQKLYQIPISLRKLPDLLYKRYAYIINKK
ncbi:MAG: LytR/AlgR family response regulator transcription factor [Mangrovibacterium sp.]